jgi:hypothetical protein
MVNQGNTLEHSTQEVHKVKKIQFGVLSEQDVLKMSVCESFPAISTIKSLDCPAEFGLNDPRMGVTTQRYHLPNLLRRYEAMPRPLWPHQAH